mmetsp:Transcript_34871/g.76211  ORF Transcript_34871/g.76211 Transcript_34871/m.76211 type:complete len:276 (-) Transcript_34871:529-1356(-)
MTASHSMLPSWYRASTLRASLTSWHHRQTAQVGGDLNVGDGLGRANRRLNKALIARLHVEDGGGVGLDGAADGLAGEDREGLLDVDSHILDAEEEESGEDLNRHRLPAALLIERDREHGEAKDEEAGGEPRVGLGDGRFEDALALAQHVVEERNVLVHGSGAHLGDLRAADDLRNDMQNVARHMHLLQGHLQLIRSEDVLELGAHVLVRAEVHLEGEGEGGGVAHELLLELLVLRRKPRQPLPHKVARPVQQAPPDLASLPPATVRAVCSEHQEK